MPDAGMFESIFKQWPTGAGVLGCAAVLILLFAYIGKPLLKWYDDRTAARRLAGKEIREREMAARESEIAARVSIAEAQRETSVHLATLGADMKATMGMAIKMHDRCHAREVAAASKGDGR